MAALARTDWSMAWLQDGEAGPMKLAHFTVSEEDAMMFNLRDMFSQSGGARQVEPGTYVRLTGNGKFWMSDTPAERRDHRVAEWAMMERPGHVLVGGLGIGMIVHVALQTPGVESVTVVEVNPDVIALVAHQFQDPRVEIVQADIWEWQPPKGKRYSVAYFDIWPELSPDNLEDYGRLKRRFARCSDYRLCWAERFLKALKAKERREDRRWRFM